MYVFRFSLSPRFDFFGRLRGGLLSAMAMTKTMKKKQDILTELAPALEKLSNSVKNLTALAAFEDEATLNNMMEKLKRGDQVDVVISVDMLDPMETSVKGVGFPWCDALESQCQFFNPAKLKKGQTRFQFPRKVHIAVLAEPDLVRASDLNLVVDKRWKRLSGDALLWGLLLGCRDALDSHTKAPTSETEALLEVYIDTMIHLPGIITLNKNNFEQIHSVMQCKEEALTLGKVESHDDYTIMLEVHETVNMLQQARISTSNKDVANFFAGKLLTGNQPHFNYRFFVLPGLREAWVY